MASKNKPTKKNTVKTPASKATPQSSQDKRPMMQLKGQYLKHIKFDGPGLNKHPQGKPTTNLTFNIATTKIESNVYEIDLSLVAEVGTEKEKIVTLRMNYGAHYLLSNIPSDQHEAVLMTEGGRLLFPYMQRIVADITRDAGLPSLQLPPVDFMQIYKKGSTKT